MAKVTSLSVQDLIDQNSGPVYVLNNSERAVGQGGDVFVTINQNGQNRSLMVPLTWLPLEVTRRIPRKYLLDSSYFLDALAKGLLIAIPAEEAQAILSRPEAVREQARLDAAEESIKAAVASRGISRNVSVVNSSMDEQEAPLQASRNTQQPGKATVTAKKGSVSISNLMDEVEEAPVAEVSARFKAFVTKLNSMDESGAMAELRLRSELTEEECHYLIDNCEHERISKILKSKLQSLEN